MLIAGNWKMNKTASETAEFCSSLKRRVDGLAGSVDISVFPPFTSARGRGRQASPDSEIAVGAQNVHWDAEGAFTGEVSAPMLRELGVYARDRRPLRAAPALRRDRRDGRARGRRAALEAGLFVIACVGETESEREAGETEDVLRRQVERRCA